MRAAFYQAAAITQRWGGESISRLISDQTQQCGTVASAQAGAQFPSSAENWVPACAGTTQQSC
jgi:hypothetical protein